MKTFLTSPNVADMLHALQIALRFAVYREKNSDRLARFFFALVSENFRAERTHTFRAVLQLFALFAHGSLLSEFYAFFPLIKPDFFRKRRHF